MTRKVDYERDTQQNLATPIDHEKDFRPQRLLKAYIVQARSFWTHAEGIDSLSLKCWPVIDDANTCGNTEHYAMT